MALQTSGAISLNDIHVEAGGSSGTQASINDSDIRDLISKGSGATMSFNEWYGASATNAVSSVDYAFWNTNGFANANSASGYSSCPWLSQPDPFINSPSNAGLLPSNRWNRDYSHTGTRPELTTSSSSFNVGTTMYNASALSSRDGECIFPVQKLVGGTYTISGTTSSPYGQDQYGDYLATNNIQVRVIVFSGHSGSTVSTIQDNKLVRNRSDSAGTNHNNESWSSSFTVSGTDGYVCVYVYWTTTMCFLSSGSLNVGQITIS